MPPDLTRRRVAVAAGVVALLAAAVVTTEFVLRGVVEDRLDAAVATRAGESLDESAVRLAASPLLWQLATGGPRVEVTIGDDAVRDIIERRLGDRVVDVWFESGLVLTELEVAIGGEPTAVDVGFEVVVAEGDIRVVPSVLRVAGFQLPARAIGRMLGAGAAEGISLSGVLPDGLDVLSVTITGDDLVAELLFSKGLTP